MLQSLLFAFVYLQAWLGVLTRDHRETNNPDVSLMVRKG